MAETNSDIGKLTGSVLRLKAQMLGFSLGLRKVLDPSTLAASLIWWRFYSFYIYLIAGAIVAGTTVLRAINNANKSPAPAP